MAFFSFCGAATHPPPHIAAGMAIHMPWPNTLCAGVGDDDAVARCIPREGKIPDLLRNDDGRLA